MKKGMIFGAMALLLGVGSSAFAADTETSELYALSQVTAGQAIETMTDSQLTNVEGMSYSRHHDCGCMGGYARSSYSWTSIDQSNSLSQANLNVGGGKNSFVPQSNYALQGNTAIVR
jgi:hypothetical protein